jgi:DNA transformation protein
MSYWRAPEACLDDRDEMTEWARKAFAAALRGRKQAAAKPQSLRHK